MNAIDIQQYQNTESSIESVSDSSDFQVDLKKIKPNSSSSGDAKRYHKIPLKTQILLFQLVFVQGKKIKQVAKQLSMNYSSAKSLIHYYKNNKRPIPGVISNILHQNKTCSFSQFKSGQQMMFVDVQIKRKSIHKYNYYNVLLSEQLTPSNSMQKITCDKVI